MSNPRFIRFGNQLYAMDAIRKVECDTLYGKCTLTYRLNTSSIDTLTVYHCSEKETYLDIKAFRDSILPQSEMYKIEK